MSFNRPTLSTLIARSRSDIEAGMARVGATVVWLRHRVLDVLARMHSGVAHGLYGYLAYLAKQILVDQAEGEFLVRHAVIWGKTPKAAVAAICTASVTGADGTSIDANVELTRADGARYIVQAAITLGSDGGVITVEAVDAGVDGNLVAGDVLTFSSPISGVDATATAIATTTSGAAEETEEELRARVLERVRNTPQGGAATDYVGWAKDVAGVTRAWCYAGWLGPGTVGLTFVMDARDNPIPLAGDVATVQAYVDALRPVTAALTVFAPATEDVNFSISITPDTPAIRTAIAAELADFFRREAEPGGTLYISRMREVISAAEGEFSHELLAPTANPTASAGAMLKLGTIGWP